MASLNAPPQYYAAEQRFREAKTAEEKLAALHEMLSLCPKHKSAQSVLMEIRKKITRVKKEASAEQTKSRQRKHAGGDFVKRAGAAQVALLGFANSGKSFLLNALTNARVASTEKPFETTSVAPAIMEFERVQIQLLDTPSVTEANKTRLFALARNADLALVVLKEEGEASERTFFDALACHKIFCSSREDSRALKKKVFEALDLIRVFTKNPRDPRVKPDYEHPVALARGSTVAGLAKEIHKELARNLLFARVWGSTRFAGQQVGGGYALADGDVVELHLKK